MRQPVNRVTGLEVLYMGQQLAPLDSVLAGGRRSSVKLPLLPCGTSIA